MQQKKFNEEKQQFEETRRIFEKRFSEYLASKEEQMPQDQQLKEEQNNIDLLRGALVQAKKELKKKKLELQNVHSALINERDSINDGWHRLEIQVEKLKQARIDIEIEKEKIANEKHEIELEKEKMKLLDSHYAEVEKS